MGRKVGWRSIWERDRREGRDLVVRDRKAPVLITDAAESPERELRRREIRYVTMMTIRALSLIAAAIVFSTKPPLWGVWLVLCIVGMVLLPWLAVIIANDRPARRRGRPQRPASSQPALPAPPEHHVIDRQPGGGPRP